MVLVMRPPTVADCGFGSRRWQGQGVKKAERAGRSDSQLDKELSRLEKLKAKETEKRVMAEAQAARPIARGSSPGELPPPSFYGRRATAPPPAFYGRRLPHLPSKAGELLLLCFLLWRASCYSTKAGRCVALTQP